MQKYLVNNGLCTEPGKYFLDAAYGKTLTDQFTQLNGEMIYNGDWNDMPNGVYLASPAGAHSPLGNDGYMWKVFVSGIDNSRLQQTYRMASNVEGTLTYFRYHESASGWWEWYSPYVNKARLGDVAFINKMWTGSGIDLDDYTTFVPDDIRGSFNAYIMTYNNHMYIGYQTSNHYACQLRLGHFPGETAYRYQSNGVWNEWKAI